MTGGRSSLRAAADAVAAGGGAVLADSERDGAVGLLVAAGLGISADTVNFMATHGRGVICVALTPGQCDALALQPMPVVGWTRPRAAFTVSVDARRDITTGISAADRALTIRLLSDPDGDPDELVRPGHIFPVRVHPDGLRRDGGIFDAAVELVRLAGVSSPAATTCEILDDDGRVAPLAELERLARRHRLPLVTVRGLLDAVITGVVVHGDRRGRELGFPTANLRVAAVETLPARGVYAARALGRAAAVSVGVRPTFGSGREPLVEVHVLDFAGDLYGCELTVELVDYLRPERRFGTVAALRAQIAADVERVRELVADR
jgi:3,4-dihydroxy-2-butanone 4-phosphate synthase